MGTCAYDQSWQEERDRLAGIERLWDAGTFALLGRLDESGTTRLSPVLVACWGRRGS